jgi:DNA-binding response OmpR family regulator
MAMIRSTLGYGGFTHEGESTAAGALRRLSKWSVGAVLVAVGSSGAGGLSLIEKIRQTFPVAILALSDQGGEQIRVDALERGADDFIQKPYLPRELLARIRATARRYENRRIPESDGPPMTTVAPPRRS